MRTPLVSLAVGLLMAGTALAMDGSRDCQASDHAPDCCPCCGAKKVCWVVECEEFCVPLPGFWKKGCDDGACGAGSGGEWAAGCEDNVCKSLHERRVVEPKCGKVRYRKKLVKKEITCRVPEYKCVVEYVCGDCCGQGCGGCAEPDARMPVAAQAGATAAPDAPLPAPGLFAN
jgi:hypothetical protein